MPHQEYVEVSLESVQPFFLRIHFDPTALAFVVDVNGEPLSDYGISGLREGVRFESATVRGTGLNLNYMGFPLPGSVMKIKFQGSFYYIVIFQAPILPYLSAPL